MLSSLWLIAKRLPLIVRGDPTIPGLNFHLGAHKIRLRRVPNTSRDATRFTLGISEVAEKYAEKEKRD